MKFFVLLFLSFLLTVINSSPYKVDDFFNGLYSKDIFSGYLSTGNPNHKLFYIFTPSQSSTPDKDPLILWLHGGPGCSSLEAFLMEAGPVVTEKFGNKFELNKYAWNNNANIIFLESPAGVGFSINKDETYNFDDPTVAKENLNAFINFFEDFPQYKDNDVYLAGASYSGVVIPFFIKAYYEQSEFQCNLKGSFIGNGLTSFEVDEERAMVHFGYGHGIVGYELMKEYERNCPHLDFYFHKSKEENIINPQKVSHRCNEIRKEIKNCFEGNDLFGIYHKCEVSSANQENIIQKILLSQKNSEEDEISILPNYCKDDYFMQDFLNQNTIKEKLSIEDKSLFWSSCSGDVSNHYHFSESFLLYKDYILNHNLRTWHLSGDSDSCIPTFGTMKWIEQLSLPIKTEWRSWHTGNQIAGYLQEYENFTFLTVKGAGHIIPLDKREAIYLAFNAFLSGELPN